MSVGTPAYGAEPGLMARASSRARSNRCELHSVHLTDVSHRSVLVMFWRAFSMLRFQIANATIA